MSIFVGTLVTVLNRLSRIAVLVIVAAGLVAASGASARSAVTARGRGLLAQINTFRAAHGLHTLRLCRQLDAASSQHSREMVADGYFGHDSADGTSALVRIKRYYPSRTHGNWAAAENLLWASPRISAAAALRAWIASPEHLRNLLDPRWRQIGVSAVHSPSAPGLYRHHAVTVITTDFGVRR